MNDANRHLLTLFAEVLEAGTPEAQAAYLDQACGSDPGLRKRLEALLRAHREAGGFLGGKASTPDLVVTVDEPARSESSGTVIGPYKLRQQIGEGGMGAVYMAEQSQPVQRKVALKLIKSGMDSRHVIARFEAERQALTLMDHPNIAKVLDAGTTESGRPYFVMELIKGVPITNYCDERRLTPKQRLELFILVCQAVQHAHQKGIIHRDLKPSNVLIALYDDKPVPKVIDFGIAKATGQKLTDRTMFTEFGQVVGTLEYMSPEQAGLNQLDIDTRSDIYSLGVLLYELLTSSTPLEKKRLRDGAMLEMLRLIREEEPPKPSTRLSTIDEMPSVAANRSLEPKKLSGLVRGELDWIAMKCLEKDRNRRYETANGLASDVQRYLADEPVLACPPSAGYRLRKFTRRNKTVLTAGTLVFMALVLGIVGSTWQAIEATVARDAESKARKEERETHDALDAAREEKEQQRRGANRELSDALVEVAGLREKSRTAPVGETEPWNQFRAALRRAEGLAGSPLAEPALVARVRSLQAELKQDEADRRMVARLEEIRLSRADKTVHIVGTHYPSYVAAFKEHGLPVFDLDVEEAARRIAASPIRDWLVAALDHCAENDGTLIARLIPVIQRVEKDKGPWVRAYYDARLRDDHPALLRLAKQPEAQQQRPITLCMLGQRISLIDPSSAIALLRQAQLRHPADLWINSDLANFLEQENFRSGAGDRKDAIGYYRVALAARPESAVLRRQLARELRTIGDEHEANAHDRHLTQLGLPGLGARNAWDWIYRASYCAGLKQWDNAFANYAKAIELEPKNAVAWSERGFVHAMLGHWDKVILDCTKAIELDPKIPRAWVSRGHAYSSLKEWDKALADNTKAIQLDPKLVIAWYDRGLVYSELKQWDKAIADYSANIELAPEFALAWYNRGKAYSNLKQWDKAIADYTKAIKLNPNDVYSHNGLAWLLATHPDPKVRDPGRAVKSAKKAVELAPKDGSCWGTLGAAQYRAGDWNRARAALEKAMELRMGGDSFDWFFLAMSYEKLGAKEKARQWYGKAADWMDKNNPQDDELRRFRNEAAELLKK